MSTYLSSTSRNHLTTPNHLTPLSLSTLPNRHFDNEFVRAPVEKWQREEERSPVEGLDPGVFANWTYDYRWVYPQAIRVHIVQVRMRESVYGLREIVTVAENSRSWLRVAVLSIDLVFGSV